MSGETRIPRDMCAGNTIPGETRIPMTPGLSISKLSYNDSYVTDPLAITYTAKLRNITELL